MLLFLGFCSVFRRKSLVLCLQIGCKITSFSLNANQFLSLFSKKSVVRTFCLWALLDALPLQVVLFQGVIRVGYGRAVVFA